MGRLTYSYDATPNFQAMPDAVIAPRNTNEVAEVLKVCNTHKIPVYVRVWNKSLRRNMST